MARKSRRSSASRKSHHRRKTHHQRRRDRRRGGALSLSNASPIADSLANSWSAKMAAGQGGDFLSYHRGQHGGMAPLSAITGSSLDASLRGSAMLSGLDRSFSDIRGLSDQAGGRRRKSRKNRRKSSKTRKDRRKSRKDRKDRRKSRRDHKNRRRRGGALGYAPIDASTMLSNLSDAAKGLNAGWKNDVAFDAAEDRQALQ